MNSFARFVVLLIFAVLLFPGCDRGKIRGLVQYQGIVTHNGKPIDEANIAFMSTGEGGRSAYASSDAQGRFIVTTLDLNNGIVKGQYAVTVVKNIFKGMQQRGGGVEVPVYDNPLPVKYQTAENTPFQIDVTKKDLEVKFDLVDQ